ncbi:hypothetical protein PDJAM_G00166940, partial [Pangasius djambal]|nr:hypothetical protein [Pangasius djambal]
MAKRRLNAPFRTALVSTTHATSRHLPLPVCSFFFCLFFPLHSSLLIFGSWLSNTKCFLDSSHLRFGPIFAFVHPNVTNAGKIG